MIQRSHHLPDDIPTCCPGHRPQLIETHGSAGPTRIGVAQPITWHIECTLCNVATVPHASKAIAELRWRMRDDPNGHTVPLHKLGEARARAYATAAAAA